MCSFTSLVMSLCLCHYNTFNGNRLTGLTCSKVPGFWMVEHQLVLKISLDGKMDQRKGYCTVDKSSLKNRFINWMLIFVV